MRAIFPLRGQRCWANYCGSYGLPHGLADRTPLVVLEWGGFEGRFRDEKGTVWHLNRVQIDSGHLYYLDGEAVLESDPKGAAYLRHSLEELKHILSVGPEKWTRPVSRFTYEDQLSRTRWRLERYGYDPDSPLPPGPAPRLTGTPKARALPNPRLPERHNGHSPRRMNS